MEIKDLKILICDDSILVRKKMKDSMLKLGCSNFFEATNGKEAVDTYKIVNPDLTFMDIVMPKESGVDALKEILAIDSNAKVVMASSVGTQNNLKTAIEAGAYDFLQKPINFDNVEKIVDRIVKEGQ